MPTQTQQDAAKRLSQGLSVSSTAGANGSSRPRYQGFVPSVIVMDQGDSQMPMIPGQQQQQQGPGMQPQMPDGMWSRRMNRYVCVCAFVMRVRRRVTTHVSISLCILDWWKNT